MEPQQPPAGEQPTSPVNARSAAVRASRVVVPLQVVFAVNGALYGTVLPRYPQIADRLLATEGQFGLALLGNGVGGLVGALLVTAVTRRIGGPARTTAWVVPVMVAGIAIVGAAPSLAVLFTALALVGLADGAVDPSMNAVAAAEQERTRTVFMGRLHASWSGALLVSTGIGAVVAGLGIGVVPHVLVGCALLLVVHAVAARRLLAVGSGLVTLEPVDEDGDGSTTGSRRPAASGRMRIAVAAVTVGVAATWIEIPPQEWAGLLFQRQLGTGPGLAGAAPFAFLVGVFACRVVLDRLVDEHGWRRVGVTAAVASAVGLGVGLPVGAVTGSPWPVLVGLVIAGAGAAPHFPLMFDRASVVAVRLGMPADTGSAAVSVLTRVSLLISPVLVGQVADRAGLFVALAIAPLAAVAMAVALLVLLRPRPVVPAPR